MKSKEDKVIDLLSRQFFLKAKYSDDGKNVSMRGYGLMPELDLTSTYCEGKSTDSEQFNARKSELMAMPDEEIDALLKEEKQKEQRLLQQEIDDKKQKKAQEFFFNKSATDEDCAHFGKRSLWNEYQFVALLLGMPPGEMSIDDIEYYKNRYLRAKDFSNLYEIVTSALLAGDLKHIRINNTVQIKPIDCVEWAQRKGIEIPEGLLRNIKLNDTQDWQALYEEKCKEVDKLERMIKKNPSASTVELETKNKMIIAMAKKKYRFDVKASKNSATKNIHSDIAECGLSVNEDTILKHLREAAEVLPQNVE